MMMMGSIARSTRSKFESTRKSYIYVAKNINRISIISKNEMKMHKLFIFILSIKNISRITRQGARRRENRKKTERK